MTDNINHPVHYTSSEAKCSCGKRIECIEITRHMNFSIGNAVKYLWRFAHKNGLEDLKKARWYLDNEITCFEKNVKEKFDKDILSFLLKPINELGILNRTENVLKAEGFKYIGDIVCHNNLDINDPSNKWLACLLKSPNFGRKSYSDLLMALMKKGINKSISMPCYFDARYQVYGESFDSNFYNLKHP